MNTHTVPRHELSALIGQLTIRPAILQFDLGTFEIQQELFLAALRQSHQDMPHDYYDVALKLEKLMCEAAPAIFHANQVAWMALWDDIGHEIGQDIHLKRFWEEKTQQADLLEQIRAIHPFRKRGCFAYEVKKAPKSHGWEIQERGVPAFTQNVEDNRKRQRKFPHPQQEIHRHHDMLKLIASLCEVISHDPRAQSQAFSVVMHQMLTLAPQSQPSTPAPEGIHQDGADFIVSGIVTEKENVCGGESTVYFSKDLAQSNIALRHTLQLGQGIFQSDLLDGFWHGVSPIRRIDTSQPGYRAILGFDFNLLPSPSQS